MGLIIEKQKTKEEDGKPDQKGEKIENGFRGKVRKVTWKKSSKETKERERKIKVKERENGSKSGHTENGKCRETTSDTEKNRQSTGEQLEDRVSIRGIDEQVNNLEIEEDDDIARSWISEDEERLVAVCVLGRSSGGLDERDGDEDNPFGSSGGLRFQEKKQPRYPSSRPTSLETIIEDSSSPFSFQQAIISSSLDSRAIYRDCRGSPDGLLARSRGAFQEVLRGTDEVGGDFLLREEKRIVFIPVPEEEPGMGALATEEELEVTLETREPGVDTVVLDGAGKVGTGDEAVLRQETSPGTEASVLLAPRKPSYSTCGLEEEHPEATFCIRKYTRTSEVVEEAHGDDTVAGVHANDGRSGGGGHFEDNFGDEFQVNDACNEGVHPQKSLSVGLDPSDCSNDHAHFKGPSLLTVGDDSQASATDEGDAGGRIVVGAKVGERCDADNHVTNNRYCGKDDEVHVPGALQERRGTVARQQDGGRLESERRTDAADPSDNIINASGDRGENDDGDVINADGGGEEGAVAAGGHDSSSTPSKEGDSHQVAERNLDDNRRATPEGRDLQEPRKVSFNIFLQLEALTEEMITQEVGEAAAEGENVTIEKESRAGTGGGTGGPPALQPEWQQEFVKAIQSLDSLNDQIVEFIFSGTDFDDDNGGSPKQREALKSSMALMRRLLVDAQSKFRKMVEDNKQLASRIDSDLQTAHQEVNLLRQELADTNRRITQLQAHTNTSPPPDSTTSPPSTTTTNTINGSSKYHSESSSNQLVEELSQLRLENEKLSARNRSLQSEVEELRRVKENIAEEDLQLKPRINEMTIELTHAKEALSALKADRKRLKAEKFDLLNQMKQLYATLEDKEKELRDFIRNYEQRMKESDESLRHLAAERDETEREKWNILKHARDESERVVKLSAQLGLKEATVKKLQEELDMVRKQLTSVGYYSDAESVRTNGLTTPTASTPACSPLPVSTPTPTPNGRGSSADSGVRLSSDRDSTASHDGTLTITVERGSLDCDTLSVCSSATAVSQYYYYACGPGTPKESPSLSPLYATPVSLRGEDQGGENITPSGAPTPTAASINSSAISGLANSSASTGGLSRSAEQLCERLSEAAESSKLRGSFTLTRKSHKGGGTWGSISRVFARQKKRAALDASLYDGNGSDKRASWSPSSSLCASPLTEESYSEKLRLLEEAQHIPLERWKAPTVLAWLEVTLGMPQYGVMCAENVRSGKVLLELSDSELEAGLGITHPMHRKKLRLAIEELREPRLTRFPRISTLGHTWVSSEWLPDLGLPQYSETFANNLVDGRLLEALTKKELEKHLGVHRKFHQASVIHGVHLLRIVRFDRQVLAERRRQSDHIDTDPVVWTNMRWIRWARSIDLAEYADNLKDSGVHGALVVLESSFTADTMATALGIPQSKNIIRRHLATELESLVNPARQQLDEQARYAKMERRRQEKLASGGSLGRSFSRSYGTGLEKGEKDKRRSSLRGSLSRALGLRLREETATGGNNGGESSSSGGQSPAVTTRTHVHHAPHARPRSSIMPSAAYVHHETHRRVKSIGDIETITVTPV